MGSGMGSKDDNDVARLLAGQSILVTGAGRGLGLAIATACHDAGAHVVLSDRDEALVQGAAQALGPGARGLVHDVTQEQGWARVANSIREHEGSLTGLVNNAGTFDPRPIEGSDPSAFRRVLDVNLVGAFLGIQAFLELRESSVPGSIVNIASVRAFVTGAGFASYSASKFGLRGLSKAAAVELGPVGVRVNTLCPGTIDTDMTRQASVGLDWQAFLGRIPLGTAGQPSDVADAACWLLSSHSAYVSGVDLPVDGGVLATGNTAVAQAANAGSRRD